LIDKSLKGLDKLKPLNYNYEQKPRAVSRGFNKF